MSSIRIPILLALLVLMMPACRSEKSFTVTPGQWPWRPVELKLNELTRFSSPSEDGERSIEVRVEFTDQAGNPTKAHGMLRISVIRPGEGDTPWEKGIDLMDLNLATAQYEPVTRSYKVVISPELEGLVPGRRIRIEASYVGDDGARLSGYKVLIWPQ